MLIKILLLLFWLFLFFWGCVRLCITVCRKADNKSIDKKAQMQMKIKAVQMIPNLEPEEAAKRIADIYEQYLREEKNHE